MDTQILINYSYHQTNFQRNFVVQQIFMEILLSSDKFGNENIVAIRQKFYKQFLSSYKILKNFLSYLSFRLIKINSCAISKEILLSGKFVWKFYYPSTNLTMKTSYCYTNFYKQFISSYKILKKFLWSDTFLLKFFNVRQIHMKTFLMDSLVFMKTYYHQTPFQRNFVVRQICMDILLSSDKFEKKNYKQFLL